MISDSYELLGLDESATDEEIRNRYSELKKKYNEDRWLDGEAGNEAARMLGRLDAAYSEIMTNRRERARGNNGSSILEEVAADIKNGNIDAAQSKLDSCNERNAEWHYLQSVIFYRKNWMNDSKKQLEIAMQIDPKNAKYKDAYKRIKDRMNYQEKSARQQSTNNGQQNESTGNAAQSDGDQMGGTGCAQCANCCYTYLCVNCLFNLCCNCR